MLKNRLNHNWGFFGFFAKETNVYYLIGLMLIQFSSFRSIRKFIKLVSCLFFNLWNRFGRNFKDLIPKPHKTRRLRRQNHSHRRLQRHLPIPQLLIKNLKIR